MSSNYDMSIHNNPDARAWAKFYCECYPGADEELMTGWFANAMMAMYDSLKGQMNDEIDSSEEQDVK